MISATTPPRCKKPLPTIRRSSSPKAGCSSRATTPNWTNCWISSSTGENRVKALLDEEQKASGISKLKLGYNRVFGYYFELSKAVGGTPPEHFIRRQTLANAERFTTVRLKELEEKLLSAADRRKSLEYKLFQQLRGALAEARPRILFMADMLAQLDYWQSLAETAVRHNWSRPVLHTGQSITIREGRHPVVEGIIGEAAFVPNDLSYGG